MALTRGQGGDQPSITRAQDRPSQGWGAGLRGSCLSGRALQGSPEHITPLPEAPLPWRMGWEPPQVQTAWVTFLAVPPQLPPQAGKSLSLTQRTSQSLGGRTRLARPLSGGHVCLSPRPARPPTEGRPEWGPGPALRLPRVTNSDAGLGQSVSAQSLNAPFLNTLPLPSGSRRPERFLLSRASRSCPTCSIAKRSAPHTADRARGQLQPDTQAHRWEEGHSGSCPLPGLGTAGRGRADLWAASPGGRAPSCSSNITNPLLQGFF